MKYLSCFIAIMSLLAANLQAQTTIHIDPEYTGGSSDGTMDHPFTSWQEVMPITSGNTYLQKRGTTCEVDYHIPLTHDVTVGAYGEGSRPIVENITRIDGNYGLFHIMNRDSAVTEFRNIVIRDFEIRGNDMTSNILIEGNVEDYTVENCVLHGTNWGIRILTWGSGEDLEYKHANRWGRILKNSITACGEDGIFIGWTFIGLEIGYNTIDDINRKYFGEFGGSNQSQYTAPGDPIQVTESNPNLWIHHNFLDKSDTEYKFALILQSNEPGPIPALVEYNVMIGQGKSTAATVYLDGNFDFIFRGNIMSNAPQAIYQKSRNAKLLAYNNVFHNVNFAVMNEGSTAAEFYNNTMIDCGGVLQASFGGNLNMMNNLMYTPDTNSQTDWLTKNNQNTAPAADQFAVDYNLVYPEHTGMWVHLGSNYDTLAQWQSAGYGTHSLVEDPLFVDPDAGDYHFQAGSPAIDAGVLIPDVTPENDAAPDIGANMEELYLVNVGQEGSIPLMGMLTPESYGPFPVDATGSFDTGDWMGWFSVTDIEGWVWSYTTGGYWYLTEEALETGAQGGGVWAYFLR